MHDIFKKKMKNKAHWKNECNHKQDEYIGSILCEHDEIGGKIWLDVYIFGADSQVCIRYGNEGSHYYSPGILLDFITRASIMPFYVYAFELMKAKGTITFKKTAVFKKKK
jgi:hypothetical protein